MANVIERWKPIVGYEGLYEVSDHGRVKSLYRNKIMRPMISNSGYERVDLFKGKKRKQRSIHRLVAEAFVPNLQKKPQVNHKDENKLNNKAENLEWVTQIENCNYGTAIARRVAHTDYAGRKIDRTNQINACSKPISQFTKDGKFVRTWKSATECSRELGFSISGIRAVVLGKRNSIYGWIFKEGVMAYQ